MKPGIKGSLSALAGKVVVSAFMTVVLFVVFEILFRFIFPEYPAPASFRAENQILPEMKNKTGYFANTFCSLNSLGMRDREYDLKKPEGAFRILLLGDSMVFGVGVDIEDTLPKQLERILNKRLKKRYEVINSGIPGFNFQDEMDMLRELLPYKPDLVIQSFIHNDIEVYRPGEPMLRSSRFIPMPSNFFSKLHSRMMPAQANGIRYFLLSHSKLYSFVSLLLKASSWSFTEAEEKEFHFNTFTHQAQKLIWSPLEDRFAEIRDIASSAGMGYAVFIYIDHVLEGTPLEKLVSILERDGIPYFNMSPFWGDRKRYTREYTLHWDLHPNARAHRLAAEKLFGFLVGRRLLPEYDMAYDLNLDEKYARLVTEYKEKQAEARKRDNDALAGYLSSLKDSIDLVEPASSGQLLFGWWPENVATGFMASAGPQRWTGPIFSFLLKASPGKRFLAIEGVSPAPGISFEIAADGRSIGKYRMGEKGPFRLSLEAPESAKEYIEFSIEAITGGYLRTKTSEGEEYSILVGVSRIYMSEQNGEDLNSSPITAPPAD